MAFVRRAPKRIQHLLLVLVVAAALLTPLQVLNSSTATAAPLPVQVSVGSNFACALSAGGIAQCWGTNQYGQLGNNSTTLSSGTPIPVTQSGIAYRSINAANAYACALAFSGQAYCWGYNGYGTAGNGGTTQQNTPAAVTQSGAIYTAISTGNQHTCALATTGQAYCWGYNVYGQLGTGDNTNYTSPVAVAQGGLIFTSIVVGNNDTCALTAGGQAYCWGYGGAGQIGNGGTGNVSTPTAATQSGVVFASISAGATHECGLTSSGLEYCWGNNASGQLGVGSTLSKVVPTAVTQSGIVYSSIGLGSGHSCANTAAGQAYCWGANNYGQVGDNSTTNRTTPVAVTQGGTTFSNVFVGDQGADTCAATAAGSVWCWGLRESGRIGDGLTAGQSNIPASVSQASLTFTQIGTGAFHTCALSNAGQAYCWGLGSNGRIGNSSSSEVAIPTAVTQGVTFTSIAVGQSHACGLSAAGQAYCWGFGSYGQIGNAGTADATSATGVTQGGVTFTSVYAGGNQSCGLTSGGQAYCWGLNGYGQLGSNGTTNQTTPAAVTQGGVTFSTLSLGSSHTCGLTGAGQAYCWGAGSGGRMGNGSNSDQPTPVTVTQGGVTFSSIAAGGVHTCALTTAGQSYCWGGNTYGELGNGGTSTATTPVATTQGSATYTSISAGIYDTCAVNAGGNAVCWGLNSNGQVGDGTYVQKTTPTAVKGQGPNLNYIGQSAGFASHTCGLNSAGKAYCWGYDINGQLGIAANPLTPVVTFYYVDSEGAVASATIDPSFSFAVAGRATACNGASTPTGAATSTSIDLGHLTTASPVIGAQDFTAATNAGGGFSVSAKFSGPLTSTGGATFANASGSAGTPAAFGSGEAFGYTTTANAGFSGPLWAGPTTSFATLYTAPGTTASVSNCIAYQAQAGPLTPSGAYSVTVIYLAVPTF